MKNYNTETDLKGLFPEKDIYIWTGETNFDSQKAQSEKEVNDDFVNMGFQTRKLQVPLFLIPSTVFSSSTDGTGYEDEITRNRLVYNVTARTGTTSITLKGSYDNTTYYTVQTKSITATGEASFFFGGTYKYYRLDTSVTGGSMTYEAYLVETAYDGLFLYKWAELIMMNASKEDGDQFWAKMIYLREEYKDKLTRAKVYYDSNDDREIQDDEAVISYQVKLQRG